MSDSKLREQLLQLLNGRNAHMSFDDAVANFPPALINTRPPNVTYSFWQLVEHLRIAQWDILDFMRNPNYKSLKFPDDYWPAPDAETDLDGWQESIAAFRADQAELAAIVTDTAVDLTADLPHAPGYSVLREINVVADHNAYHIGELAILRQVVAAW